MQVRYSINGHYLKDFGIYVSESKGIADALNRKAVQKYDWAEYHGASVDLSNPKYEEREIELKCFVRGADWEQMFNNFNSIIRDQFSKGGTQRLMIEPFNYKALVYEVYVTDDVQVSKRFRNGEMFGVFSLKMKEPNPIKKVLKVTGETFSLSYDSEAETEVFWGDGTKSVFPGNVSEDKDYAFPSYQISGYSIVEQSNINPDHYQANGNYPGAQSFQFSVNAVLTVPSNLILYVIGRTENGTYELVGNTSIKSGIVGNNMLKVVLNVDISQYGKFIYKILDDQGFEVPGLTYNNPRMEQADINGEWQNMAGKNKYVVIAGNIDQLKNVSTDAEVLWTKL